MPGQRHSHPTPLFFYMYAKWVDGPFRDGVVMQTLSGWLDDGGSVRDYVYGG